MEETKIWYKFDDGTTVVEFKRDGDIYSSDPQGIPLKAWKGFYEHNLAVASRPNAKGKVQDAISRNKVGIEECNRRLAAGEYYANKSPRIYTVL